MKLYTEEEVVRAIELSDGRPTDEVLAGLTRIKLPSDEEIKESMGHYDESDTDDEAFLAGAKWMRDKIKGGNK